MNFKLAESISVISSKLIDNIMLIKTLKLTYKMFYNQNKRKIAGSLLQDFLPVVSSFSAS